MSAARVPAVVLGGSHGALSVARQLGRLGVPVHAVNRAGAAVLASRYARPHAIPDSAPFAEGALLRLRECPDGALLLAASDDAIELLLDQREALATRFRLDLCHPPAQRSLLDKLLTYQAAREAGVAAPRFWVLGSRAELERVEDELVYPLLVKPRLSHVFQQRFRAKFLEAHGPDELRHALAFAEEAGVATVLMERIPGPDHLLCSYYTYLDEQGRALFDFTKRIVRRQPVGMGLACHHVTDHVEGLREPALRLFRHVGLQGVANVEFKLDPRDGVYKLIECNARFTAANALVARAGIDIAGLVYSRAFGLPLPRLDSFRDGLRLWSPGRDWLAFLELRRRGELGALGWLHSVLRPTSLPVFSRRDPRPSLAELARRAHKLLAT